MYIKAIGYTDGMFIVLLSILIKFNSVFMYGLSKLLPVLGLVCVTRITFCFKKKSEISIKKSSMMVIGNNFSLIVYIMCRQLEKKMIFCKM